MVLRLEHAALCATVAEAAERRMQVQSEGFEPWFWLHKPSTSVQKSKLNLK